VAGSFRWTSLATTCSQTGYQRSVGATTWSSISASEAGWFKAVLVHEICVKPSRREGCCMGLGFRVTLPYNPCSRCNNCLLQTAAATPVYCKRETHRPNNTLRCVLR
jgi:hypothetical protein